MATVREDLKKMFLGSSVVGKYILVSVLLFLVLRILKFAGLDLVPWLSVPSSPITLLSRPWSFITYMFTHFEARHIFWNMILLHLAGRIFTDLLSDRQFIKTYWLGGIIGALLYFSAYNLIPSLQVSYAMLLGASGSILAILFAVTAFRPNHEIHLPLIGAIKLVYVTAVLTIASLPMNAMNTGGELAHLGGALWGGFYGFRLRKGSDTAKWFDETANTVMSLIANRKTRRKPKMKVYNQSEYRATPPRDDQEYNAVKKAKQKEVDLILDKISKSGYESLTSQEKSILFKASNKN